MAASPVPEYGIERNGKMFKVSEEALKLMKSQGFLNVLTLQAN